MTFHRHTGKRHDAGGGWKEDERVHFSPHPQTVKNICGILLLGPAIYTNSQCSCILYVPENVGMWHFRKTAAAHKRDTTQEWRQTPTDSGHRPYFSRTAVRLEHWLTQHMYKMDLNSTHSVNIFTLKFQWGAWMPLSPRTNLSQQPQTYKRR